jgi:hypothetical protein
MTIQRMDNVLIVVDDLEPAKAFFAELGMELEGETTVEGRLVDRVVGLNDVRADITMMRTPDGHSRVELTKFHTPPAVRAEPENAPANAFAAGHTHPLPAGRDEPMIVTSLPLRMRTESETCRPSRPSSTSTAHGVC